MAEGVRKSEGREIRTPNLLIWSQTRCRCAIPPLQKSCGIDICAMRNDRREEGARQICKGVGLGAGAKTELGFPSTTRIRSETGKMVARKVREKIRGLSAGEGCAF